jgi:hypothetical protein
LLFAGEDQASGGFSRSHQCGISAQARADQRRGILLFDAGNSSVLWLSKWTGLTGAPSEMNPLRPACAAASALLLLALSSCTRKETKLLLESRQALGTVLAEETARAAGPRKQVALILPHWAAASRAGDAFKAALNKEGLAIVDGGAEPGTAASGKLDAVHQSFSEHYHILRAPD